MIGAVSASGPLARIDDGRVGALAALVQQAARAISADMGGPGDGPGRPEARR